MPGIVGLVTKMPREQAERQLARMVRAMMHSETYVSGTYICESSGIYVGWVARAGSFCSEMPILNETGEISLVFAGEEFAEPGTVSRLKASGHELGTSSASYLVHLSEEDPSFPANLNGRFHGVLMDRTRRRNVLFNDRYGMQRIYYHDAQDAFYFAAEAKAILVDRPELRQLDLQSLGEFVSCGCVLGNRSLFRGIHVLPPASAWNLGDGVVEKRGEYFNPREWEDQEPLDEKQYYQSLRDVFAENCGRYFGGPEAVGVSLTGGLDSRMVMAWRKSTSKATPCYSFGGTFRDCQDVVIAREVAAVCGQAHQVIPVGQEFLSGFTNYAERTVYLTDGCVGVNHAPDLYVNEIAAAIAPVRLTGNYGGEVLRRVRAFKLAKSIPDVFAPEIYSYADAARNTFRDLTDVHPLSFATFRQAPWHHFGLLSLEETQVALRSPFLDNDFVKTVYRAPAATLNSNDVSLRLISDGNPKLGQIPTDRGLKLGRAGFWANARREWIEFTVKAEYAYDYGMPNWLAKVDRAFAPIQLERLFLGRHKFSHFRYWYRNELSGQVSEMLLDPRTLSRPVFDARAITAMVRDHINGERNCAVGIHKALTLELIHRLFLDA